MKKTLKIAVSAIMLTAVVTTGCQKGDLLSNPNAISSDAVLPINLILNHITANFIKAEEKPFGADASKNENAYKADQYLVSNYDKYWGKNEYGWSNTDNAYEMLRYAIVLEKQATAQLGATNNKYLAIAKFFRAYASIWLAQRVGDIPMTQAGDPNNLTPAYDTQHDVYKNSLQLLDDANTMLNAYFASGVGAGTQNTAFNTANGDIFNLTNQQWQKLINSYRLRVLISLSKRADDTADLNIKTQFNAMVTNPTTYPIMTSNSDNMVYKFNSVNTYPNYASGSNAYNNFLFIGKPVLDITTATADPRTFLFATPVDKTKFNQFDQYKGAPTGTSVSVLFGATTFSNFNSARYFNTTVSGKADKLNNLGALSELFIFIGYPELCFNVAEGINRGWAPALTAVNAQTWYNNGIIASCANLGLTITGPNQQIATSDGAGTNLGTVTTDYATFSANIAYNTATPATALNQILTQKYVALFMNSGWEAFYNYRRTGVPAFATGAGNTGYNTANGAIPRRFLYPLDETTANSANYKAAINSQFGGSEDIYKDTFLTK